MNPGLLSLLLLVSGAAVNALPCLEIQKEAALEIFKSNIGFQIPGYKKYSASLASCEYIVRPEKAYMKIVMIVQGQKCGFNFPVLVLDEVYTMHPSNTVKDQAQSCGVAIQAGSPVVEKTNVAVPKEVLPMVFDEKHEQKVLEQKQAEELKKIGGEDKQELIIAAMEKKIVEAMNKLAEQHGLDQNDELNDFFNREETNDKLTKVVPKKRVALGAAPKLGGAPITNEHPLAGGWSPCTAQQKQRYLNDVLAETEMPTDAFNVNQVIRCSLQIVAGLNVKITFGVSEEQACHYHIFYPLNNGLPIFQARRVLCLPEVKKTPLVIGAPSKPSDCSLNLIRMTLNALREKAGDTILQYATEENVLKCTQQFADGTKIRMKMSFDGNVCDYFAFLTPAGQYVSSGIESCVPQ